MLAVVLDVDPLLALELAALVVELEVALVLDPLDVLLVAVPVLAFEELPVDSAPVDAVPLDMPAVEAEPVAPLVPVSVLDDVAKEPAPFVVVLSVVAASAPPVALELAPPRPVAPGSCSLQWRLATLAIAKKTARRALRHGDSCARFSMPDSGSDAFPPGSITMTPLTAPPHGQRAKRRRFRAKARGRVAPLSPSLQAPGMTSRSCRSGDIESVPAHATAKKRREKRIANIATTDGSSLACRPR